VRLRPCRQFRYQILGSDRVGCVSCSRGAVLWQRYLADTRYLKDPDGAVRSNRSAGWQSKLRRWHRSHCLQFHLFRREVVNSVLKHNALASIRFFKLVSLLSWPAIEAEPASRSALPATLSSGSTPASPRFIHAEPRIQARLNIVSAEAAPRTIPLANAVAPLARRAFSALEIPSLLHKLGAHKSGVIVWQIQIQIQTRNILVTQVKPETSC
jgi:hypothetical protein